MWWVHPGVFPPGAGVWPSAFVMAEALGGVVLVGLTYAAMGLVVGMVFRRIGVVVVACVAWLLVIEQVAWGLSLARGGRLHHDLQPYAIRRRRGTDWPVRPTRRGRPAPAHRADLIVWVLLAYAIGSVALVRHSIRVVSRRKRRSHRWRSAPAQIAACHTQ